MKKWKTTNFSKDCSGDPFGKLPDKKISTKKKSSSKKKTGARSEPKASGWRTNYKDLEARYQKRK